MLRPRLLVPSANRVRHEREADAGAWWPTPYSSVVGMSAAVIVNAEKCAAKCARLEETVAEMVAALKALEVAYTKERNTFFVNSVNLASGAPESPGDVKLLAEMDEVLAQTAVALAKSRGEG